MWIRPADSRSNSCASPRRGFGSDGFNGMNETRYGKSCRPFAFRSAERVRSPEKRAHWSQTSRYKFNFGSWGFFLFLSHFPITNRKSMKQHPEYEGCGCKKMSMTPERVLSVPIDRPPIRKLRLRGATAAQAQKHHAFRGIASTSGQRGTSKCRPRSPLPRAVPRRTATVATAPRHRRTMPGRSSAPDSPKYPSPECRRCVPAPV